MTLVEDVVSTGGAILDSVEMLRADGIFPSNVVCVIDRETGGAENLAAEGIHMYALYTMSEIEGLGATLR